MHEARRRTWEVVSVPEATPISGRVEDLGAAYMNVWFYQGWTLIMTLHTDILLDPEWSLAWRQLGAPYAQSASGRVLTTTLPVSTTMTQQSQGPLYV